MEDLELLRKRGVLKGSIVFSAGTAVGMCLTTLMFIAFLYYFSRKYNVNVLRLLKFQTPGDARLASHVKDESGSALVEALAGDAGQHGKELPLPSEMMVLLSSVKVFGYLDEPIFLELCRHLQVVSLPAGAVLFSEGTFRMKKAKKKQMPLGSLSKKSSISSVTSSDPDSLGFIEHLAERRGSSMFGVLEDDLAHLDENVVDNSLYIVINGHLQIFVIDEHTGEEHLINDVREGETVTSLCKVLSTLTGTECIPLDMHARALTDTRLVKLPSIAFDKLRETMPQSIPRIIQVILARFQRVTFWTVYRFLGLTKELVDIEKATHTAISSSSLPDNMNDLTTEEIRVLAAESFCQNLGPLPPESLNFQDVEIHRYQENTTILKQGERTPGLYLLLDGIIDVSMMHSSTLSQNQSEILFTVRSGGVLGYLAALTGHPSLITARTKVLCKVAYLSKSILMSKAEHYPAILETLAKRIISNASPIVHQIDFALDWIQLSAGQILYRQGDDPDAIYIVLSGRLGSFIDVGKKKGLYEAEHGRGESIGEVEVLTDSPRPVTVFAIRDTEIAKIPKTLFRLVALAYPQVMIQMSRIIASRFKLRNGIEAKINGTRAKSNNIKTICVLPASNDVPIAEFSIQLTSALNKIGPTLLLDASIVAAHLGKHAFSRVGKLKLVSWLDELEDTHRALIFQADQVTSPWTQRCIKQADCILIVGFIDQDPCIGDYEKLLQSMKVSTRKDLVLIHHQRSPRSQSSTAWLRERDYIRMHHHIFMPVLAMAPSSTRHALLADVLTPLASQNKFMARMGITSGSPVIGVAPRLSSVSLAQTKSDFARLARILSGTCIGLVLGGGGARGFAHLGVIQALEEAGIPIDMIGGCSMGAFVAALYARELNHVAIRGRARRFAFFISSKWRQIWDLTYPITSWFTGRFMNYVLRSALSDIKIEDLRLSFFAVTTNISLSRLEVHQHGSLWRFVRASMSLSGYLPPLCDKGHMLVDGGYLNNVPADVMRDLGCEIIIAVDVGADEDLTVMNYGDSLSGWWLLWKRFFRWGKQPRYPTLADIQYRLAYVSSYAKLEEIKNMPNCYYIRVPIANFKTLDFYRFDEILLAGYTHASALFVEWKKSELFKDLFEKEERMMPKNERRGSI
jgi:predicted acylesterase/phospholipase RssA/CRP-like cAMP-binding protein